MPTRASDLLTLTREGLYCPLGRFHVDPTWPVERALITHGHADHARVGPRPRAGDARDAADHGGALRRGFLPPAAGGAARRGDPRRRRHRALRARRPRPRLGADRHRAGRASGWWSRATTSARRTRPACPSRWCPATCSSPRRPSGCRSSRHPDTRGEVRKLLASVALFPERAHIVGAYALGKAQRVMALLREEGWDRPIYLHGAMEKLTALYKDEGLPLGDTPKVVAAERKDLHGAIVICPPSVDPGPVVAEIPRSGDLLRLGLDAGARPRPPEGRRAAAGDLRPFRLAGPVPHHPRYRRRGGLGDARPGGRAGPLVRDAGHQGEAAAPAGLRRRRRGRAAARETGPGTEAAA